ncbi:DUF4097 family beta strand repeat-containing protein [Euzebyella saccharophila]|uniref:Adhesin domain-containing protein n=1 Tax=Euzebyella saccharophila TaxID=679664 RepID=A0ABV8JRB1_9FLAO|nr:hypothetical protein [Euzebyella saccharophila]
MLRYLFLLFCCTQILSAQKVVKKSIVDTHIAYINIDVNNCFLLNLTTVKSKEISVEATIDGEYKQDLAVKLRQDGDNFFVSSGFQPLFHNPNDKLSAHKVVSIALEVEVPEYLEVVVFGKSCNVNAGGNYRSLSITLNDGYCKLNEVKESVKVETQSGQIDVIAAAAMITANNKFGATFIEDLPNSDVHYNLSTVTGDIRVRKTE